MKKMLGLILLVSMSLMADINTDTLEGMNKSGNLFAGGMGIGAVHVMFWLPIGVFFMISIAIIGAYVKMLKQKDDGVGKLVASIFVGIALGSIGYAVTLSAVDGLMNADGCGRSMVTAYMKDSIKLGLSPGSYTFGTAIKQVNCMQ